MLKLIRRVLIAVLLWLVVTITVFVFDFDVKRPHTFLLNQPFFYLFNIEKPFVFITDLYGLQYKGFSGDYIDASVLVLGAFEKSTLHLLKDLMISLAGEGGVFVDIGVNVGQHFLFMSQHARL
mgnify:FL=1